MCADRLTTERRSWNMGRIRSKDTIPERVVRSLLHQCGLRFSLRRKELPGKPDIVLPARNTVVFVHGCFWHRHEGCSNATVPSTRRDFWGKKFQGTIRRDKVVSSKLKELGWRVVTVWECELRDLVKVRNRLLRELKSTERFGL